MFDNCGIPGPLMMMLPLLLAAVVMLILPSTAASGARPHAHATTLAMLLFTGLIALCASRTDDHVRLMPTQYIVVTMSMLAATLIAAPLIDRARARGLILAAGIAALGIVYVTFYHLPGMLPNIARSMWLHVIVLASCTMGILGSMALPAHYARFTNEGQARWQQVAQGPLLAGWVGLCIGMQALFNAMATEFTPLFPIMVCILVSALFALLRARSAPFDPRLQKVGEAVAAGWLISIHAHLNLDTALIAGLVAGFSASKSEAFTNALRIDDPHHLAGALFFPALIGLLMPGLMDLGLLAIQLRWIGAALAMGFVGAVVMWPAVMFVFGLAARREE